MGDKNESSHNPDESSVTMLDVIEHELEMEEQYCAVLGASDEKECSYQRGALKRQALYSCLTCCPDAQNNLDKCAGVCLACSYHCHENHELVELYTKRNFRCDCPTEKFENKCVLNPTIKLPQPKNKNSYGQNFQGVYCTCHRPYPDPEYEGKEVMLQCSICEDWFHINHLDATSASEKLAKSDCEMICGDCMSKHEFLRDYTAMALSTIQDLDESSLNVTDEGNVTVHEGEDNDNKLRSDLDKSISDIMNMSEMKNVEKVSNSSNKTTINDEPPACKRTKLEEEIVNDQTPSSSTEYITCKRPKIKSDYEKGATFWRSDWQTLLCQCSICSDMYTKNGVGFLLDKEDRVKLYEERGLERANPLPCFEQGMRALASWDRVKQIDAITEYNRMKDKLKAYLQTFVVNNKVVTEEDINNFFTEMRRENNSNSGHPYLSR